MTGADAGKTAIKYKFPKEHFSCFVAPTPPAPGPTPQPPAPVGPTDKEVGISCSKAADTCGNKDDSTSYCCGIFAGGKLLDDKGAVVDGSSAPNVVACNINPDGDKKPA